MHLHIGKVLFKHAERLRKVEIEGVKEEVVTENRRPNLMLANESSPYNTITQASQLRVEPAKVLPSHLSEYRT